MLAAFLKLLWMGCSRYLVAERSTDLFAQKILDLVDLEQRKKIWQKSIINVMDFMDNC